MVPDVLANDLIIHADRGDEVASAPEALLGEGALPGERVVGSDGALALKESHGIGHGMLGWNAQPVDYQGIFRQ
jgi:hypothetical protein